jgi:hypothetical protein
LGGMSFFVGACASMGKAIGPRTWLAGEAQDGSIVFKVLAAFWASLATMYGNHGDWAMLVLLALRGSPWNR